MNILARYEKNEKGQVLVVMLVMMVIALSTGIAISNRYIKGLRNITESDNSSKALGVAEAAIEHILLLPITTLEDYALNGTCTTDCYLEITDTTGQVLSASVDLTKLGDSTEPFLVDLKEDETTQINLAGYPENENIYICWNDPSMSVTGLYIHGTVGNYDADAFAYNPPTTSHPENAFDTTTSLFGYSNCITLTSQADSSLLRFKAVYSENVAVVLPAAGQVIPTQGILIESTGAAGEATRVVSVIITEPILPAQFEYVLYQKSTTEPLSN